MTEAAHLPRPRAVALKRALVAFARFVRELYSQPQSAVGTTIVLCFLVLALFGQAIAPYGENDINHVPFQAPNRDYPMGTDNLGRDIFSRVLLGAQSILFTAGVGTLIAVFIGTLIGLFTGYQGGLLDEVVGRFIDAILAMPAMLVALVILGVIKSAELRPGSLEAKLANQAVLLVIALVYVPVVARVVRSATLDIKTRPFIEAAQIRGESAAYIIFREIFPSVVPALVVEASLRFSYAIFLVASLGFLGVGASPPTPDWGLMVNEARRWYGVTRWALEYPALAISVLVIGVNLMSDGIKRVVQKSG